MMTKMKRMKIWKDIMVMTLAALSFNSCGDEKDGDWDPMVWKADVPVQMTDGVYAVPANGTELTFSCRNYSAPWIENAESKGKYYFPPREANDYHTISAGWFKAEMNGNKLKVVFEVNGTAEERPLQLTVTAGDIFYTFKFVQSANEHEIDLEQPTATTALSLSNAPIIDGSDSTEPLRNLLMCRLLDIDCQWLQHLETDGTWGVVPKWHSLSNEDNKTLQRILQNRNTHSSFVSLIDGENDIIITARGISRDEQKYADEKGIQLLSRPVAKDAFVFIVNPKNPVRDLSIGQIQKIYTGEIRNWKEVGGNDAIINPYVRNPNSGSQEKMETIVMAGLTMIQWPEMVGYVMLAPYYQLANDENGIAYTPFYYYDTIVNDDRTQVIGVDGITPSKQTIEDDSYPYVTHVMASVRADKDKSSTAYQLFYQLATGQHNDVVKESGYIVK